MKAPASVLWLSIVVMLLCPTLAFGASKDDLALKLDQDAINNDYLAMKFDDCDRKLRQALAICGQTGCSPSVMAQLHRDLGIVYVGWNRPEEAKVQFAEAVRGDPSTVIPKDLATPDVNLAFAAGVQAAMGGSKAPAARAPAAPVEAPPPRRRAAAAAGEDEINHTPPVEQTILTAVPLYAKMPDDVHPSRVVIRYKPFGALDWKTVDMRKMKSGYGIELPCLEIGSTPGDLKYYIQALGPDGEVIVATGSKSAPLKVPIKTEITDDPPHLPGRRAPAQCTTSTVNECPPDFPGCKATQKSAVGVCGLDSECQSGSCKNGRCSDAPATRTGTSCETDKECGGPGHVCKAGICATNVKKNWFGLVVQQDMVYFPAAKDACLNGTFYTCYDGSGAYYPPNQNATRAGVGDEVKAGFGLATSRLLLTYDRLMNDNIQLGGRLGYAWGGGPDGISASSLRPNSPFVPVHIEARSSLWIGSEPFTKTGVRPYLVAAFGFAQFDAQVGVQIQEGLQSGTLIAWKRSGLWFASGGLGTMFALGRNTGPFVEIRGQRMFPAAGTAMTFQLGYAVGI